MTFDIAILSFISLVAGITYTGILSESHARRIKRGDYNYRWYLP